MLSYDRVKAHMVRAIDEMEKIEKEIAAEIKAKPDDGKLRNALSLHLARSACVLKNCVDMEKMYSQIRPPSHMGGLEMVGHPSYKGGLEMISELTAVSELTPGQQQDFRNLQMDPVYMLSRLSEMLQQCIDMISVNDGVRIVREAR